MSEPEQPKRFIFSPFRILDWLDKKPESFRRIGQGLILTLIVGIAGLALQSRMSLAGWILSGWKYFLSVITFSVQISIWQLCVYLSLPFLAAWFAILVALNYRKIHRLESELKPISENEIKHDNEIFRKLNAIMDEPTYRAIYFEIKSNFKLSQSGYDTFLDFHRVMETIEFEFIDITLRQVFHELCLKMQGLILDVNSKMTPLFGGGFQINPERIRHPIGSPEEQKLLERQKAISESNVKLFAQYNAFRRAVKNKLFM